MSRVTINITHRDDEPQAAHRARIISELSVGQELFYKPDGSVWLVSPPHAPRLVDGSIDRFYTALCDVAEWVKPDSDGRLLSCTPSRDLTLQLLGCHERRSLPCLTQVVLDPAIYFDQGAPAVTKPGYDVSTGIYYIVRGAPVIVRDSTSYLTTLFSGVPFEEPHHRNAVLAWLLGAIILDSSIEAPLLVVSGNQAGIGKSKTIEALGYILTGTAPAPIDPSGDEFDKQVGARFAEGGRFINLDNVTARDGTYKNSRLARILTAGFSKSVRLLGHSRSVSQSGVLFALSANDCRLEHDLAVRALAVKLYREQLQPMDPYVVDYAHAHRSEILGELLGLALRPPTIAALAAPGFRFRAWYNFVAPRIASVFGTLLLDESADLDDIVLEVASWGLDTDKTVTAADLLAVIQADAARFPAVSDAVLTKASDRMRKRAVSLILKRLVGRRISLSSGLFLTLTLVEPLTHKAPASYVWIKEDTHATTA